jgi:hypothetical protein
VQVTLDHLATTTDPGVRKRAEGRLGGRMSDGALAFP